MQGLKSFRKHFENPSGSDKAVFDRDFNPGTILNTELREFLATPRKVPYRLREEIAEVLIHELLSGKDYEIKDEKLFMGKFGVFYPLFLDNNIYWDHISAIPGKNSLYRTICPVND